MSGRSPEERERARLEREARRAAREGGEKAPRSGGGLLGGLLGSKDENGELPAEDGSAATPEEAAPPDAPSPRPPDSHEAPAPAARPDPGEQDLQQRRAPAAPAPRATGRETGPPPAEPVRRKAPALDLDRVRRLTRERRERAAGAAAAPPPGEAPPARGRRFGRIFAGVAVAGVLVLVWLLFSIFQPFKGDGAGEVRVAIPTGAGVGEIADLLDAEGVISNATFFEVRATLEGARGDLKPGAHVLKEDMSYAAAIAALSAGPPDNIVRLTIPEGRSRSELAELVADAGLEGDYEEATLESRVLRPRKYGAERARDLEGFLWPATYEVERGSSVQSLVNKQLRAFKSAFGEVSLRRARRANLTPYDVLTIASMVEREAQLDEERPVIASVIYNRLRRGEPLGIDATIRFATDNWTKPLTASDLRLDSPYNTRTTRGLPPTPIGSPGLASIEAAADPANTDFLFYVVKPNTCGEHAFSETLAEFERDAARYNREREARGGRSPTDC